MIPAISVDQISMRYPSGRQALAGVSFTVDPGEIFGLIGPNGAGKTTLISILAGLFPPTAGTAAIRGHDVSRQARQAKMLLGVVPQELALYPQLTGRANLALFGALYNLGGAALKAAVQEALAIAGLEDRADDRVARYSGGMKRRLNLAAALVHAPPILLLDEISSGLDPENRRAMLDLIKRLAQERQVTALYSTHRLDEISALCGRIAILHQGRILAVDTLPALLARLPDDAAPRQMAAPPDLETLFLHLTGQLYPPD